MKALSADALARAPVRGDAAAGAARLSSDEVSVLVAAALVLMPPELDLRAQPVSPAAEPLQETIRALWLRSGMAPLSPMAMPEQAFSPGIVGLFWRRLRAALGVWT